MSTAYECRPVVSTSAVLQRIRTKVSGAFQQYAREEDEGKLGNVCECRSGMVVIVKVAIGKYGCDREMYGVYSLCNSSATADHVSG